MYHGSFAAHGFRGWVNPVRRLLVQRLHGLAEFARGERRGRQREPLLENAEAHALCLRQPCLCPVDLAAPAAGQPESVRHAQREHHVQHTGLPGHPRQAPHAQPVQSKEEALGFRLGGQPRQPRALPGQLPLGEYITAVCGDIFDFLFATATA